MNTDKIYAEHLANEYAPKDDSIIQKLRRLESLTKRQKCLQRFLPIHSELSQRLLQALECVFQ